MLLLKPLTKKTPTKCQGLAVWVTLTETFQVSWLNWAKAQRLTLMDGMYFLVTDCFLNKLGKHFSTESSD